MGYVNSLEGTPKSSKFIRVFHYFHHPYFGVFGNTLKSFGAYIFFHPNSEGWRTPKPQAFQVSQVEVEGPLSNSFPEETRRFEAFGGRKIMGICRFDSWQGKYMDVSKNRGTPKWMVYNGKPY